MTASLLVGTVAAVGVLHTLVPDHWAPIVVIARQRRWSALRTLQAAAIAGLGHVTTTLLLGVVLWAAGASLAQRYGHVVNVVAAGALIAFGLWIAYGGWRELRDRSHEIDGDDAGDHHVFTVSQSVYVHLGGGFQKPIHQARKRLLQVLRATDIFHQRIFIIGDHHRAPPQHVGGTHRHRILHATSPAVGTRFHARCRKNARFPARYQTTMRTAPRTRKPRPMMSGGPTPNHESPEAEFFGSARLTHDLTKTAVRMRAPTSGATPTRRKFFALRKSSRR